MSGADAVSARRVAEALGLHPPTAEQAAVIEAARSPSLVVAGAGAGKTETMAARVVWLVANGHVEAEHVLGLTFTRKAARQLSERVRARLRRLAGSGLLDELDPTGVRRTAVLATEPTVLTYHAYAGRLVAEHGLRLPVEPDARVLTGTAAWQLAHHVVATWDGDLDTDRTPATVTGYVLALASELSEHLVDPERLVAHAESLAEVVENAPLGPKQRKPELPVALADIVVAQRTRAALLPLVAAYTRAKRDAGAVDFADQMAMAARLAEGHPEVVGTERERYHAVLLDEYQDTGHAQRVLLRNLFGGAAGACLPITAVGDPAQAIYGWRGASAANLPRFTTDFPVRPAPDPGRASVDLAPAPRYGLLTSFRNPERVLTLANAVSEPLREAGLQVDELRAREGAQQADIACARLPDAVSEREWLAEEVARRWHGIRAERGEPPTAAVLVRRRADMAEIAAALRERGLPVEVVGLGGLLDEPEVRDLVSTLRVLVDPLAGSAAARLLTGSRWRLGAADFVALWRRARLLASADAGGGSEDGMLAGVNIDAALPGEQAEQAGLADAVDDPGDPAQYSEEGYRRIERLRAELTALRARMGQSLPELVADVERTLGLDIEAMARPGPTGRVHLDAFSRVVTEFAQASPTASVSSLLDYLATAERAEDGLARGEVEVATEKVQVLTMHAAKGLEWELVAVPHLVGGVFPAAKRAASWLRSVPRLPVELRGDAADLPSLRVSAGLDRKELAAAFDEHEADFERDRLTEERRLFYVALTRSAGTLLCSGHWWAAGARKPRKPSPFLTELAESIAADPSLGSLDRWAEEPGEAESNPLSAETRSAEWPADPLGPRREQVRAGAELVTAELADLRGPQAAGRVGDPGEEPVDTGDDAEAAEWARDVDVLLAERAAAVDGTDRVSLPAQLSVSGLVELAGDRDALARRLRRPLPFPPNPAARRGTAFHRWLEQRFGSAPLLDLDELPGAADDGAADDGAADDGAADDGAAAHGAFGDAGAGSRELDTLRQAFEASEWADRMPREVEVPFETTVEGLVVRGRMDAVFADPDGGWTVVDWKTGAVPEQDRLPAAAVQLAVYRLAWAALAGVEPERVRAAFHYVRQNHTIRPADLLDADGLRAMLRSVPEAADGSDHE